MVPPALRGPGFWTALCRSVGAIAHERTFHSQRALAHRPDGRSPWGISKAQFREMAHPWPHGKSKLLRWVQLRRGAELHEKIYPNPPRLDYAAVSSPAAH